MTKEDLAAQLDGSAYPFRIPKELIIHAADNRSFSLCTAIRERLLRITGQGRKEAQC